jgi:hypothetical protein
MILLQNIAKFDTFLKHYFFYIFLKKNLNFSKSKKNLQTQQNFPKPSRLFPNPADFFQTQQRFTKPSRVIPNPAEIIKFKMLNHACPF